MILKQSHYKIFLFLPIFACVFGFFLVACSHQNKLLVRSNIVYKKGDVINLKVENFLQPNTEKTVLEEAILYSNLLDSDCYSIDENCNVVTKGKDYLEIGTYYITIVYQNEIKTISFKVLK